MAIDTSLEFVSINIAVLTISDTRTEETDTSCALLKERINTAGHHCIEKKIIPNFLVDKSINTVDLATLLDGLKLVGDYLDKTILKPNNLHQPISRLQFINTLK